MIVQLLVRDPSVRLGAKNDAAEIKEHPFFRDVNWDEIEKKVKDGPYINKDNNILLKELPNVQKYKHFQIEIVDADDLKR